MDTFVGGKWYSQDVDISKMHADAIVGVNNQFYLDQPVNTSDAAFGAVVDIINLEPVKYLTKAAKIQGRLARRIYNNSALGKSINEVTEKGMSKLSFAGAKLGSNSAFRNVVSDPIEKIGNKIVSGKNIITAKVKYLGTATQQFIKSKPALIGTEFALAKELQKIRMFAANVPSAWLKLSSTGKKIANVSTRLALDTFSEMTQEGVQGLT